MAFHNETDKIKDKIAKYLGDSPMDIGCGNTKVAENAFAIDGREFPHVDFVVDGLYGLPDKLPTHIKTHSSLFVSHVLEHLPDMYRAIDEWGEFIKKDAYLIIQLPEGSIYANVENKEHFHDTMYEQFLFWFRRTWCGEALNYKGEQYAPAVYELIEHGLDIGEDRYSFFLVAKKLW
jgi:predicted SAM-dependent methyltransferase